jgi:6-phosphogluconolactonase (cycloisomerase 2 family)
VQRRLAPIAALVVIFCALCGASASAATLYAPSYGAMPEGLTGFALAADGSPSVLAGSPFPVPAMPSGVHALAFTPDGGRAVTTYLFDGGIQGHTVAPDGSIAIAGDAILTPSIQGLAVSPDGRFAYAPTRDFKMEAPVGILGYSIAPNGAVEQLSSSPFGSGEYGDLAITPDGRFLFGISGGQIRHFSIAADGELSEVGTPTPAFVRYLAVSPDGRFLFTGSSGGGDEVRSFSIGPNGDLTQNGMPVVVGTGLGYFAVAPDSRTIYMPNHQTDGVVTASIGADGTLTPIGTTPVANPESLAVSPDGRFLYSATSGLPGTVLVGSIGADGMATMLPFSAELRSGEPTRIMVAPTPTPESSFRATRAAPGAAASFDASSSARAVRFDWDFGDGTTLPDGGATPTHTYAQPGAYEVRLTVTDAQGCSTRQFYTGQTTVCPGGASATSTATLDTLPVLGSLSVVNRRFAVPAASRPRVRRGTAFRYVLSEAARVTFTIRRRTTGRRVRGRCRPATRRNRGRPRCALFKRVGRLAATGKAGRNRTRFSGKLRGRRLPPGRYRATAVARDAAGGRSAPRSVRFRIVRP